MRTKDQLATDLTALRCELCTAEDCKEHRPVDEIRDEIRAVREQRRALIPKQREP